MRCTCGWRGIAKVVRWRVRVAGGMQLAVVRTI